MFHIPRLTTPKGAQHLQVCQNSGNHWNQVDSSASRAGISWETALLKHVHHRCLIVSVLRIEELVH